MEIDNDKSNADYFTANADGFLPLLRLLRRVRIGFWLTVPTGALVGFFLAMEEFSSGFDVPALALCSAILLAIVAAHLIFLRRSRAGRVVCAAGGWGVWVLLGAAAGGGVGAWKIITAAVILGAYCGAVEIVAVRTKTQIPQKFGLAAYPFSAVSVTACVGLAVVSFSVHGFASVSPWVSVWITLWVSFRSIYCSILLRAPVQPEIPRQLAVQLQRGVLLLQGGIMTGLLRNQAGAIGFIVAMFLLSACNFLDKRSKN